MITLISGGKPYIVHRVDKFLIVTNTLMKTFSTASNMLDVKNVHWMGTVTLMDISIVITVMLSLRKNALKIKTLENILKSI